MSKKENKYKFPRKENGRIDVEQFLIDRPWHTYRFDAAKHVTNQDRIDFLEHEQKGILEKLKKYKETGEDPKNLIEHLNRSKNDVIELTKLLS